MSTPHNNRTSLPVIRLGWLDGLRGWAVMMVVGIHAWFKVVLGIEQGMSLTPDIEPYLMFNTGAWGVQLFYTISGFTMCYMWQRYKPTPHKIRDFLIRRFFRLAPMMYFLIVGTLIAQQYEHNTWQIILSFLFLTDLAPQTIFSIAPGGTTIDLEFTFYLLFPFLVLYMHRWWIPVICIGIHMIWDSVLENINYDFHYHFILIQAMYFVIGGYVYHLWFTGVGKKLFNNYFMLPLIFAFGIYFDHQNGVLHAETMGIYFGILLLSSAYSKFPLFDNTIMQFIGKLSFSIYLLHWTFVPAMAYYIKVYGGLLYGFSSMVIVIIPTILVSIITYRYIEQPGIRLGKKLIMKLNG